MFILNIESSSTVCSVSLSLNGQTIFLKEENNGFTHAENLHLFIEDVLKSGNIQASRLDAIAVGIGPGSYTGLRIGMSTAKGLCYALNKPLIGIASLQAMSAGVKEITEMKSGDVLIPLVDARRMEAYFSVFDDQLNEIEKTDCKIITDESVADWRKYSSTIFFGSGLEKSKNFLNKLPQPKFVESILPSAKWMEKLSYEKFRKKDFENIAYAEPLYAKEFFNTASQKE
ncbi:MAG: tRNA (adenosine(37)-N6)-threonylcarbamoyltransferase complex dimerization subunit type 1 TsaB [Bacteroidia bacterium]|nr:tRNA (adenosine(37)-N6)-threonylcarbamoyltransferase complex dimerization subunit type 1 TsaB [Bacteroidia bacterium]